MAKRKKLTKLAKLTTRWLAPAGIILVLLSTAVNFFVPQSHFQQAKERLLKNPADFESLLVLAEEFLANNQFAAAEQTLRLAQEIQPGNSFLEALWQKKHYNDPKDIHRLISAWEKIAEEKPNCRDCFFQLALLHAKLYQDEQTRMYLNQVLSLDPNFEPGKELEKILSRR